jgi:CRP-like cAMP-binding protein
VEFDEVKVNRGRYLYEEGDPVDGFYLIKEGDFQVSKQVGSKSSFSSEPEARQNLNLP